MPAHRAPLLSTLLLVTLSGCVPGLATSNPTYFSGGKWSGLDKPYALTPLLACAEPADNNDKVIRNIEDYVAPALWSAYGQDVANAKVKKLKGDSEWCEALPNIATDKFNVPPRMKQDLARYVKEAGAKGIIIPVATLYRSPIQRELRTEDGTPFASVDTDRFIADGTALFYVHYINESGELLHTERAGSGGDGAFDDRLKYMRDSAAAVAKRLTQGAPPVDLQ
ncbi:hypothetical protein [Myxococcus qinghaiensis]|uniref:hypothetical protein n=1 Tax=Myxococcus qinghaiensis TaxID=2906758 RepID=UPI0020A79B7E|nr:hypothetical protein [Myxococcus qinghaiensis]MCP3164168.1 hypothetical protein [Myxococcus qinghaiensis]